MRKIGLEELRRIQLEILEDVHLFCRQNGIRYSLCGGTMLGAVRHQGYIPWDDDIDLMMPRPDYERFAATYKSSRNRLIDLRNHPACVELCLKVERNDTVLKDLALGRTLWGINIDIFPIDGAPERAVEHCMQILSLRRRIARICPFYKVVESRKAVWFLKYVVKRILFPYPTSFLSLKQGVDRKAAACRMEESALSGVILGSYAEKELVPTAVFESFFPTPFEGKEYMAIEGYDTYLSAIYGNYMELPPEEKRVTHHLYDAFIDD